MHPPSGWVHVRLWWHTDQPPAHDYVTAQVIGGGRLGVTGSSGKTKREPSGLRRSESLAGFTLAEIDINLNPVTPPGIYPVYIGLHRSGQVGCERSGDVRRGRDAH